MIFGLSGKALLVAGVLLAASLGALAIQTWRHEAAVAALGAAEERIEAKNQQIISQEGVIGDLKDARANDQAITLELASNIERIDKERQESDRRLSQWRTELASRTLKKPEVTQRAARIALIRLQREICRSTGGSDDACD